MNCISNNKEAKFFICKLSHHTQDRLLYFYDVNFRYLVCVNLTIKLVWPMLLKRKFFGWHSCRKKCVKFSQKQIVWAHKRQKTIGQKALKQCWKTMPPVGIFFSWFFFLEKRHHHFPFYFIVKHNGSKNQTRSSKFLKLFEVNKYKSYIHFQTQPTIIIKVPPWPSGHGIRLGIWGSGVQTPAGTSRQPLILGCQKK